MARAKLTGWDYIVELNSQLQLLGDFVKYNKMRVTFHPDHFTLINTPREDVFQASVADLMHHCRLLDAMRLDDQAKLVTHDLTLTDSVDVMAGSIIFDTSTLNILIKSMLLYSTC
jgi:UV DNA damage repair endonuclease